MAARQQTVRWLVMYGALGAAFAGATATGCSGDDTASNDGGPAADVAVDQGVDATQPVDASQPETSLPEAAPDAPHDAFLPDNSTADNSAADADASVDAFTEADVQQSDVAHDVTATETGPTDASDAGADSADVTAPSDAGDGGVCVTTVSGLPGGAEAGAGDSGLSPTILFSFDSPGGLDIGWSGYTSPTAISTASLGQTLSDGFPCPGALQFGVTYTGFSVASGVVYNYANGAGAQNWTGRTSLHLWVKLLTSNYPSIGLQPDVQSNAFGLKRLGAFLPGATFSAGSWVEEVISLVPSDPEAGPVDYDPTTVDLIELKLTTQTTQVDGGPTAPPPVTMLVDSIWLE